MVALCYITLNRIALYNIALHYITPHSQVQVEPGGDGARRRDEPLHDAGVVRRARGRDGDITLHYITLQYTGMVRRARGATARSPTVTRI